VLNAKQSNELSAVLQLIPTNWEALPNKEFLAVKALINQVLLAQKRFPQMVKNQLETQGYVDKKLAKSTMSFLSDIVEYDPELEQIFKDAEKAIGKYLPPQAKREDMLSLLFGDPYIEIDVS
jgi:hypothetical protein